MEKYDVKTKIFFGENALNHLQEIKCNKAFIVTDPFMIESGAINNVTERLDKVKIAYEIFSDILPDPPIEIVARGIKAMDSFNPEVLIALGGGSAIDAAKAISYFRGLVRKGLESQCKINKPLFIAIPTTSGTGSEVTAFSVITDKRENIKYPLVDGELLPDEAILDVCFVKTVPKLITADTGMDVLTHGIEAYVSKNASDFTDALAEKAIKLVFKYLHKAYKDGRDKEAREKMHSASCIAGMAFTNASLGINHSMAHILGGRFHIPHGRANAILLPYVIEYNANIERSFTKNYTYAAKKYLEIAKLLGLYSGNNVKEGVKSLINGIKSLTRNLEIPLSIKELGISQNDFMEQLDDMVKIALKDGCTPTNPRKPEEIEIKELFKKAYYGKQSIF